MESIFGLLMVFTVINFVSCNKLCPKQCDCDMDDGLNRAVCVDQNIVSIDVGVPKEVQVYSLSHNAISELENYCFKESGYQSIQILNLSYNLIFWIGLHAFAGLDKLLHLDLSNNRLRQVPSDLFWDTPQLKTLDLSENVFEILKNEPFIMHNELQILNLKNSRINALPDRLFTRLPNLRKLDLSDNYVITLSTELLRPLRKLERIELRNEYWKCNPDFVAIENWIVSRGITYEKQCKKKKANMMEKIISVVVTERTDININDVWNITVEKNETVPKRTPTKRMTPFEKFDKEFSAIQAFILGIEVGLGVGIVVTYIWLRASCRCYQLSCRRPPAPTRRQRRAHREGDRRTLLWTNVINPDLETPPLYRRELSLPDRSPPYGLPRSVDAGLQVDAIRLPDRAETPPPPYNEVRINM